MLNTEYDNIGLADRLARVVLGIALIAAIFNPNFNAYWISLLSVYPIMTAIMAWDPFYALINTLTSRMSSGNRSLTHAPA